ncbi:hypothetical protein BASA81_005159 [Batrachochytrium salamandrivorans]|nr:hypothetical protein BASA81_005159 [Batrachochytrium salamandrivorans]
MRTFSKKNNVRYKTSLTVGTNGEADRICLCLARNDTLSTSTNALMVQLIGNGGGEIGSIRSTNTATSYNTSSDYRLKKNIEPITDGLSKVMQLKPSYFNWNSDEDYDPKTCGFVAHEVQEVIPYAVFGTKDDVYEDGKIRTQGMDASRLISHLVSAVQTLTTRVEQLEAGLRP